MVKVRTKAGRRCPGSWLIFARKPASDTMAHRRCSATLGRSRGTAMLAQRRLRDAEHARNVRFLSSVTELFCLIELFGEPGRKEVSSRSGHRLKTGQPA